MLNPMEGMTREFDNAIEPNTMYGVANLDLELYDPTG